MTDLDCCVVCGDDPESIVDEVVEKLGDRADFGVVFFHDVDPEDVVSGLSYGVERFVGCVAGEGHYPGSVEGRKISLLALKMEWMAKFGTGGLVHRDLGEASRGALEEALDDLDFDPYDVSYSALNLKDPKRIVMYRPIIGITFVDGVTFHNLGGTGLEVLSGFKFGSGPAAENVRTFGALSSDPEFDSAPVICDKGVFERGVVYAAVSTFLKVGWSFASSLKPVTKLGTITESREDNVIVEIDGRPAGEVYIERLKEVADHAEICSNEYVYKDLPPLGVVRVLPPVGYRVIPRTPLEVTDDTIRTAGYVVEGEQLLLLSFDGKPNAPVEAYRSSLSSGEEPLASILVTCAGRKPLKDEIPDKRCLGMYSFGEITPIAGYNEFHNHVSACLTIFREPVFS
ncbi:FIST signal transduction protein [Methanopyrus sp.]